jgi:hypothetical protein
MNEQTMITVFLIALVVVHLVVGLLSLYLLKRDIKAQATRLDAVFRPAPAAEYNFTVGDVATSEMVKAAARTSKPR